MSTENKQVKVRPATPGDGPDILRLIKGLADFEKLAPPDEAAQKRLLEDAFGPRPRFDIFVAEVEGTIAGYAFIFETYSTFQARPKLYLEDIFVSEEYRGYKVGLALFRQCVAEAERRDCGRMEWAVLDWNRHAINFYERLGARHQQEWLPYGLNREQFGAIINPS
jgi:GNAT superfamily N-acetyltransferase